MTLKPCPTCGNIRATSKADRWAPFTDEELLGLDACFDACFEHSTPTLTTVRSIVFEVEAELERRRA